MATTVQKITLSSSRDIPFNKLVLSQSNVRRVKAGVSIEELAEDIARRTLLQSLSVRPVLDTEGAETGMFEVPAGGRRYRALQHLVKQKRLAKTAPVPCVVRDPGVGISAEEDSLAENVQRAPLHPLDQFRAFQALREKGQSEEDIAAAFFVGVNVVKQRLRLAAVSEKLLDVYAEDGMSLDQLMAFTVTNDHARQEQVWETLQRSYSQEPYQIRRMLTERTVRASDKRVQFVGLDAYEQAGGIVMRDLFQQDDGGWLENVGLLDGLVAEKLKAEAEQIAGEGWKWIEVNVDFPFGHTHHLRELDGTPIDLTAEEQATIDSLSAEYAKLEADYENADELPDEVDARLGEIETALAAFEGRPLRYDPAEIARAGVFVSIDADGGLSVDRAYVRPEDEAPAAVDGEAEVEADVDQHDGDEPSSPTVQRAVITIGGQTEPEEDEDDVVKPLPDRLVSELTAYRTLALRDAVANNPHVAMTALLHKLCLDTFQHTATYDVGLETLRAESFAVTDRRAIYTHPGTGAETRLLTITQRERNRPVTLDDALGRLSDPRAVLLVNERSGRAAVQVPAPSLMLDDGEIERRVRLIRPMENHSLPLKMMAESHWIEAGQQRFAAVWQAELAEVTAFTDSTIHIVAGLLLPIWKRLPNESTRVYRLQTDAGERIIGRKVSPAWVATALAADTPALTTENAFAALMDGRTILELAEGLQLRRVRVMGTNRIELSGFTDTMRDRLKAYGLFHEIISWKLRMFVPTDASGVGVLAKVLEHYPLERIGEREAA